MRMPGMIPPMNLAEARDVHVGIDLGGGDIRMTEHLLNRANIRPVREHVRGETVAKNVGRNPVRRDAHGRGTFANDLENALTSERTSQARHENVSLAEIAARKRFTRAAQIRDKSASRPAADRHQPLFRALAENAQKLPFGDDRVELQIANLAYPQSAAVHDLEHRAIAQILRLVLHDRIQKREDFRFRKRLG